MHASDPTIISSSGLYTTTPPAPAVDAVITGPLGSLPEEVLLLLFSKLDSAKDVTALGLGCRKLHQLSLDEAGIWRPLYRTHFPEARSSSDPAAANDHLSLYKGFATVRHNVKAEAYTTLQLHNHGYIKSIEVVGDLLYMGFLNNTTIQVFDLTTGKCLQTLEGHERAVTSLKVVGDRLFSASYDRTVKLWDLTTGECLRTFTGHDGNVQIIKVFGNQLFTTSSDKTVKIWDTATGECRQTLKGHHSGITYLKVDGDQVCTGSCDTLVLIWDTTKGDWIRSFNGMASGSRPFIQVGNRLFLGSKDKTIKVWDRETGECLQTFRGHEDFIAYLKVDGNRLYSGSSGTVKIWDVATEECLQTLRGHESLITYLKVVGRCLYSGSMDAMVKIWDKETGECLLTLKDDPRSNGFARVFGNRLITASGEHVITIRDFGFPCLSSYPLQLLEENLAVLRKMVGHQQEQDVETIMKLADELHPDFKQRLDEYCPEGGTSSTVSKEAILHVQAVVYAEVLLHAIHDKNWEGVHGILEQLQSIDPGHVDKLYKLLEIECGKDSASQWGEQAFRDTLGYSAPIHSKLEAARKFREALKGSSNFDCMQQE